MAVNLDNLLMLDFADLELRVYANCIKEQAGHHVCQHASVRSSTGIISYLGHSYMIAMFALSREVSCED